MVWGAIASAAIGAAGSYFGAKNQNSANSAISQKQMDFQREMSNTSYTRGMADMRSAGLNPILAYKQGGASTPTGASIPAQNELGAAVEGGLTAASTSSAVNLQKAQAKNTTANTKLLNNQSLLAASNTAKSAAETQKVLQEVRQSSAGTQSWFGKGAFDVQRIIERLWPAIEKNSAVKAAAQGGSYKPGPLRVRITPSKPAPRRQKKPN